MITKKTCPRCGSDEIVIIDRAGTWMCKHCRYAGRDVEEEEIIGGELEMVDKTMKKTRRRK